MWFAYIENVLHYPFQIRKSDQELKTLENEASASNENGTELLGETKKDQRPESKKLSSDNQNQRKNDTKKPEPDGEKAPCDTLTVAKESDNSVSQMFQYLVNCYSLQSVPVIIW